MLEKRVREYERKFKALDAIRNAKDKVARLRGELAWAWVHAAEQVRWLLVRPGDRWDLWVQ